MILCLCLRSKDMLAKIFVVVFLCASVFTLATAAYSSTLSLPHLYEAEAMITDGPEVLAAISAMGRDSQLEELERQRMGARYFFNATFGYSDEPLFETSDETKHYMKAGIGAGLIFPLLGTWSKQKISALDAEIRSVESRYRPQIITLHNLTALRKAYVTLWAECEKVKLAERFLSTEDSVSRVMADRQQKGLLLPADRLEFLTGFDMARRDISVSNLRKTQALQIIRLATGRLWSMPESMNIPSLPAFLGLTADVANHPEILMRKETLKRYEKLLETKRRVDREGTFTIGATAAKDVPGTIGTGVYAVLNITEPVRTAKSKEDKINLAARDDLKRAQREEIFIHIRVEGEAEEAVALAGYAVVNIQTQESRLAAMSEAVRERIMRHAAIAGDTFEQLQKSRYQYYRVVMDIIDSEMIFMQTGADLLSYAYPGGRVTEPNDRFCPIAESAMRTRLLNPAWLIADSIVPGGNVQIKPLNENKQPETLGANVTPVPIILKPTIKIEKTAFVAPQNEGTVREPEIAVSKKSEPKVISSNAISGGPKTVQSYANSGYIETANTDDSDVNYPKSVYVWDAAPFLLPETRNTSLMEVKSEGFSHMLISFNSAQLEKLDIYYGRMELEDLLSSAQLYGIRVDLMLGDPNWLYQKERAKLINIVSKMSKFKFAGLHLDIEPDSLPDSQDRRPELLKELVATVKEVKSSTNMPLSLSVHPRYLEGELGLISNSGFSQLGIEYVSVMLYSTNPDAVSERIKRIMLMQPRLKISLAQSVENNLPSENSYMSFGLEAYKKSMEKLALSLNGSGNYKGIFIQSWEDYRGMLQ